MIYNHFIAVVGAAILLLGVFGWALEPSVAADVGLRPAGPDADGPGHRARHGGERLMAEPNDDAPGSSSPLDDKTSGHGAPDLGNEPSAGGGNTVTETIDEIPMGGLPGPGPRPRRSTPARSARA